MINAVNFLRKKAPSHIFNKVLYTALLLTIFPTLCRHCTNCKGYVITVATAFAKPPSTNDSNAVKVYDMKRLRSLKRIFDMQFINVSRNYLY